MVNGRMPLYLTLLVAALSVAAVLTLQPYSADYPGTAYAKPAQRYIRAALRRDSIGLARLSAAVGPVEWALDAAQPALTPGSEIVSPRFFVFTVRGRVDS